ncbi:MAG TPA: glycosyltransferase family 39 protein [Myxococcota bacterium]|nr:glycosyltransferase family 39 protein [Myxococcota bacterium]
MSRRALAAVLFAGLAIGLFWHLGTPPPHHRGEKRSDAIAREIVASGHWLFPTLDGTARLQKPPLFYWAAAGAAELAGGPSAVTLRSVSALAALGLLAVTWAWAVRALDETTAGVCALALAAMPQFWLSARLGTADMLLVFLCTAALALFQRLTQSRDPRLLPALAALIALAFLAKATAALVDVGVPVVAWLALEHELNLSLRPRVLRWAALCAVGSLAWYVAALVWVPEASARLREFFFVPLGSGHSDLASDHYRPFYWYVPRLFGAALPAVLLLPLVIRDAVRFRFWRDLPALRFAALCFLSLFVVWSGIPQKGRHYLLPMLPWLAVLAGDSLVRAARRA